MNRRAFLATAAAAGIAQAQRGGRTPIDPAKLPPAIKNLRPMTDGVKPITAEERQSRIEKAGRLMHENHLGAIIVEPGSTMFYYTGRRTPNSTLVIPAAGEIAWFVPGNTADTPAGDVRHGGDSTKALTQILTDRKAAGRIGIEERVRFATYDALHRESPAREFVSADPVTIGCRVIKSPAEIALLQRANDVTVAAYRAAFSTLHEGMDQRELSAYIDAAYQALGFRGGAMVIYGKYTAFPHGSVQPQTLHDGDFVLVDDGCSVEGYQSDITRTVIFGKPTDRQRRVWDLERKAQDAALAAAKPGATCESVDAAARKVITDAGFGPGYKVPGLPHRTGHGIGLDGHEWTYLVKGNKTRMEPGMCFSNEPTIAIYGEFGVRLEDCMYITPDGARMFTAQSPAIDRPFA